MQKVNRTTGHGPLSSTNIITRQNEDNLRLIMIHTMMSILDTMAFSCARMTPSMQISQPPAEIYALTIELAGVEDKHSYHHLDINTLLSLCHVSRLFHALTIPVLYSSIDLPSFNAIRKLEVRKANPRLLHHTRAIFFTSAVWLAQIVSIVPGATEFQRLCRPALIAGQFYISFQGLV